MMTNVYKNINSNNDNSSSNNTYNNMIIMIISIVVTGYSYGKNNDNVSVKMTLNTKSEESDLAI